MCVCVWFIFSIGRANRLTNETIASLSGQNAEALHCACVNPPWPLNCMQGACPPDFRGVFTSSLRLRSSPLMFCFLFVLLVQDQGQD